MRAYISLRYVILHVTSKFLGSAQHIQNITVSLLLQHFLLDTLYIQTAMCQARHRHCDPPMTTTLSFESWRAQGGYYSRRKGAKSKRKMIFDCKLK